MSYTKGEWVRSGLNIRINGDEIVYSVLNQSKEGYGQLKENAQLISASPCLLIACEALARKHRETHGLDGAFDEELVLAESAINKAKGV